MSNDLSSARIEMSSGFSDSMVKANKLENVVLGTSDIAKQILSAARQGIDSLEAKVDSNHVETKKEIKELSDRVEKNHSEVMSILTLLAQQLRTPEQQ